METRSAAKKRNRSRSIDRISDLPDAVLHRILFLLPIKIVSQSSVLSKRWRNICPNIKISSTTTGKSHSLSKSNSQNSKEADFIRQVITFRDKQSGIQILRFRSRLSFSRLNGLIRLAIRHNVQELDVDVATEDYFNFPRCVIASESLRVFKLKSLDPGFRLPPSSVMTGGFKCLQSLSLSCIILYNQPSLGYVHRLFFPYAQETEPGCLFWVKHLLVGCRALQDLTWENVFSFKDWMFLIPSDSNYFAVDLNPFNNLKSLELHTCFNKNNITGLACIFKISPMLHTLILNIVNDYKIVRREEEKYWESQTQTLKPFLQNLKVVKIHGFLEYETEVSLTKFLLKHGKALEEMILCTGHCKAKYSFHRQKIRSQMMGFSWASSNAKIAFH
ncbi:F-box/FBD/LRR-repeat protein [Pyrus ussuriensis x Pyrus communis]|uniref:F-box/FBD/LRR-repeat protein n=1 Tax=Pyrus ussuriensis x Pyrus communis TaxID=2448454 RepID=A0A5N5GA31_9ROSA|nr:F-box/FBD/LRR-repeat protein [Pyrus ussuriensis x Pyrus communis]